MATDSGEILYAIFNLDRVLNYGTSNGHAEYEFQILS
jgi:hypothetical protein